MGHCPFCKGAVNKDLLMAGGTCPHCLIEIPGEEAPTDPGEQAIARQQEEKAVAAKGKGPLLGVIATAVLLAAGGGGYYAWSQSQQNAAELAEADEWTVISIDAHQNQYLEDAEESKGRGTGGSAGGSASAGGAPSTGGQLASGGGSASPTRSGINPAGSYSEQVASADPTASGQVAVGGLGSVGATTSLGSPGSLSGPSIAVASAGAQEVLKDPAAIEDMIKRAAARQGRQLEDCYNDRLKIDESLQGRWSVAFTIDTSGKTKDIGIKGLNTSDAEFEACLMQRLSAWRFSAIVQDTAIQKTYTFRK